MRAKEIVYMFESDNGMNVQFDINLGGYLVEESLKSSDVLRSYGDYSVSKIHLEDARTIMLILEDK